MSEPAIQPAGPRRSPLDPLLAAVQALRPRQWTKNGLLLAALLFSFSFTDPELVLRALAGVASFCLVSSTGYLFNDIRDREADARHPKKRHRPIASGRLPLPAAWGLTASCLVAGLGLALALSPGFLAVALLYFATTMSYTLVFKHHAILDVMFIAAGFLWRAAAGAVAISVAISPWLLVCTGFLALFLGFNKRRGELALLEEDAARFRRNLAIYTPALLDEFQAITTSGTVISYALWCVLGSTTPWMLVTLPHVLYVIFRYIYLVQAQGKGDAPDETLVSDVPILVTTGLYGLTVILVLLLAPS